MSIMPFRPIRCDCRGQEEITELGEGDFEGQCKGFRRGQEKSFQCAIWHFAARPVIDIVVVVAVIVNVKLERLLLNQNFASSKIGS